MVMNSREAQATLQLRMEQPTSMDESLKAHSAHAALSFDSDSGSDSDSYTDSDYTSSWDEEGLTEIEQRVQEFSVVGATPALAAMVFNTERFKLNTRTKEESDASSFNGVPSASIIDPRRFQIRQSNSDACIQATEYSSSSNADEDNQMKPDDCLSSLLREQGISIAPVSSDSLQGFFFEMKAENFACYDNQIAHACRSGDLDAVREHVGAGKPLLCCNKFKESTIHTICRRGHEELLRYAIHGAHSPICVRDEQGRTPLHDAAWAHEPNFELVKLLLANCPDLLLIKDNRGFTPLSYAGRPCWKKWCDFLEENRHLLAPKTLTVN